MTAVYVYTLVCCACHAGWKSALPTGTCARCGRPAVRRGVYAVVPLERPLGDDFFEEDESAEKIEAIWNRAGRKGRTARST